MALTERLGPFYWSLMETKPLLVLLTNNGRRDSRLF
ncbi:MAG: hypothetical protein JWR61_2986 [Ferruginibacter sp.]|nr:hypothetical protein [Ferruginibacter sp.]